MIAKIRIQVDAARRQIYQQWIAAAGQHVNCQHAVVISHRDTVFLRRGQTVEEIAAIGGGCRRHDRCAVVRRAAKRIRAGGGQCQSHIANARLAGILHAVAVQIVPHGVTDGAGRGLVVAEIRVQINRFHRHVHQLRVVAAGQDFVGEDVVTVRDHHAVVAGNGHAGEKIMAIGIRRLCAHQLIIRRTAKCVGAGIVKGHGHIGNARLRRVLHAVAVQVLPNRVADHRRLIDIGEIGGHVIGRIIAGCRRADLGPVNDGCRAGIEERIQLEAHQDIAVSPGRQVAQIADHIATGCNAIALIRRSIEQRAMCW